MSGSITQAAELNANVLVEAKNEYTQQLKNFLTTPIYDGIKSIYDDTKDTCERNGDTNVLKAFQLSLKLIPKWNQEIIDDEYNRILKVTGCDWLEDLIKAVFISNVKVLSSVSLSKRSRPIQLDVPSGKQFLHKCYIEVAKNVYTNPYLLNHNIDKKIMINKNTQKTMEIIEKAIEESIRKLVPVKEVLQQYLGDDQDTDSDNDIENGVSDARLNNLKKMVDKELADSMITSVAPEEQEMIDNQDQDDVDDVNSVDSVDSVDNNTDAVDDAEGEEPEIVIEDGEDPFEPVEQPEGSQEEFEHELDQPPEKEPEHIEDPTEVEPGEIAPLPIQTPEENSLSTADELKQIQVNITNRDKRQIHNDITPAERFPKKEQPEVAPRLEHDQIAKTMQEKARIHPPTATISRSNKQIAIDPTKKKSVKQRTSLFFDDAVDDFDDFD